MAAKNQPRAKMNWKKYGFEFLSIFIAVIAAFALNNWNENRKDNIAENKILNEISNGLSKDLEDIAINIKGHQFGIENCKYFRDLLTKTDINIKEFTPHYFNLTRSYTSIQNVSGYESLKSKGLELIKDDSLRSKIVQIYEYDYQVVQKIEEDYEEMQFHKHYFFPINAYLAPHVKFGKNGMPQKIKLPIELSEEDKNSYFSYLFKIEQNRSQIIYLYSKTEDKIKALNKEIKQALKG